MPSIPQDYYRIYSLSELEQGDAPTPVVEYYRELCEREKNQALYVFNFSQFMAAAQLGFRRIHYECHNLPLGDGMAIFWINEEHAAGIGRVLDSSMEYLELRLSCEEDGAFYTLVGHIKEGVHIPAISIRHMTYDEVTQSEIRGLARLIHKLDVHDFSLYSADFQAGIFDAMVSELNELENTSLKKCAIFDVTRPEGENEISIDVLDRWMKS